ncbi:hypothetical protein [Asticcacaulis taihuensis]|uniref:hypothetical protein n=1 Tax=Asticcacaulis taihuensis TaxID=260084 RepID=UPI0026EAA5A9|nr:hypothetical protein [Asticcacaulis taihuensis]
MMSPLQAAEALTVEEAKRLFARLFGTHEGEKALLYMLVKIGGVGALRFSADSQTRLILDGKQEAVLEIMHLAGFSPFQLAQRLMAIPPLPVQPLATERSGNETLPVQNPKPRAGRRSGRAAPTIAASAVSDADAFAGDAPAPTGDASASDAPGDAPRDAEGVLERPAGGSED